MFLEYISAYKNIYREIERVYGASRSIKSFVFRVRISNLNVQTVEHDLHIELSLEVKIYVFFNFLLFFRWVQNR
jgi:N-glycosylase/DNA lyase